MSGDKSEIIAKLNDEFRTRLELRTLVTDSPPGRVVITPAIQKLSVASYLMLLTAIREQTHFEEGDDPHREHDFGTVQLPDQPPIAWKIDYYADDSLTEGSETPEDATKSYRVLTIMLLSEY